MLIQHFIKLLLASLFLILSAVSAFSQAQPKIEKGSASELKGITKVFIFTETDKENRILIEEQIKKDLPKVTILVEGNEAEIALTFSGKKINAPTGPLGKRSRVFKEGVSSITNVQHLTGAGQVFLLPDNKRTAVRLLLQTVSTQDLLGEDKPAVKFAKEFVQAYKKANEIKKEKLKL